MSGRASIDHKLPHRIQDWVRSSGGTPATERDADAIVAWLRGQRGSEYARKPADVLRRSVLKTIERTRSQKPSTVPQDATSTMPADEPALSWSINTVPAPLDVPGQVGMKRPASPSHVQPRDKTPRSASMATPVANFNLLNSSIVRTYEAEATAACAAAAPASGVAGVAVAVSGADSARAPCGPEPSSAAPSEQGPVAAEVAGISTAAAATSEAAATAATAAAPAAGAAAAAGGGPSSSKRRLHKREKRAEAQKAAQAGAGSGESEKQLSYEDLGGMDSVLQEVC